MSQQTSSITTEANTLSSQVGQLFAEWDRWDSPGAALAIWQAGAITYKRGYGCANLEYTIPITPTTIFHVASVSKQFTAAAILLLAQQGQLALDDDIRRYLPYVPDLGHTITIRHLVHHISGLRDQWELLTMAGWRMDDVITREHIRKMVQHQQGLNFAPGAQYLYCNTGYTLLADLVEKVAGQPFPDFAATHFFKPLGMVHTHFHDDHERIVPNRAYSYVPKEDGGFKKLVLNYATVGASSLFTTVEDLTRWVENFASGQVGGASFCEQMCQQGVLNDRTQIDYAFGLRVWDYRGAKAISHSGGDAGFRSHLLYLPNHQFAVVILSNLATMRPGELCLRIADLYLAGQLGPAETAALSIPEPPLVIDPALAAAYAGHYLCEDGSLITITKAENRLLAAMPWDDSIELTPLTEAKFLLPKHNGTLTFARTESGQIDHLSLQFYGETVTAQCVSPVSLTAADLAAYTGEYDSQELGALYTLVVQDDKLVIQHRRHSDVALTPTVTDQFASNTWWVMRVLFTRAATGAVIGFSLSGGRVKNIQFVKR